MGLLNKRLLKERILQIAQSKGVASSPKAILKWSLK